MAKMQRSICYNETHDICPGFSCAPDSDSIMLDLSLWLQNACMASDFWGRSNLQWKNDSKPFPVSFKQFDSWYRWWDWPTRNSYFCLLIDFFSFWSFIIIKNTNEIPLWPFLIYNTTIPTSQTQNGGENGFIFAVECALETTCLTIWIS